MRAPERMAGRSFPGNRREGRAARGPTAAVLAFLFALVPWAPAGSSVLPPAATQAAAAPSAVVGTQTPRLLRAVVQPYPGGRAAGIAVLVPVGTGDDPEGREGAFWLLGHALAAAAEAAGVHHALSVDVSMDRDFTIFQAAAPADGWEEAHRTLLRVLFEDPLPPSAVEDVRSDLVSRLVFEEGAPVRRFEREVDRLLFGVAHPWARARRGRVSGLREMEPPLLEELRQAHYRADESLLSLVAPVAPREVADRIAVEDLLVLDPRGLRVLEEEPGAESADPAPISLPSARPREGDDPAWTSEDRIAIDRETTSTWLAAAFPAPPSASRQALAFLSQVVRERLTRSPPDPDLYELRVSVEEVPGGPVLLLEAAVAPAAAFEWEARLLSSVDEIRERPPRGDFFHLARRRFRNRELLDHAAPDALGRRIVRELHLHGTAIAPGTGDREPNVDDLGITVGALGPARVLLLGPLEMARPVSMGGERERAPVGRKPDGGGGRLDGGGIVRYFLPVFAESYTGVPR